MALKAQHQIYLVMPLGSYGLSPPAFMLFSLLCKDLPSLSVWCRDFEEPPPVPSDSPRPAIRWQDDQRADVVQDLHAGSQGCPRRLLRQDLLWGGQSVTASQPVLVTGAA